VQLIEELGVGAEVKRLGYVIRALRVVTPGDREMLLQTEQAAVVLLRKHFDNLLVEQAQRLGAQFRPEWKAVGLLHEGGRVVGVRSKDEEIRADYVVCAD